MFQYLINVSNTLVPGILLFALLAGSVSIFPENGRKLSLKVGLIVGVLAALVLSILKLNTGFVVREMYDIRVLVPLMFSELLTVLVVFIYSKRKNLFLSYLFTVLVFILSGTLAAYTLPDMFMYPFEFAVRMDNIYNTEYVYKWTGYLFATGVALLGALAVYRLCHVAARKVYLFIYFATTIVLFANHLLNTSYIVLGRGLIDRKGRLYAVLMEFAIFIGSKSSLFFYAIVVCAVLLALAVYIAAKRRPVVGANPAEKRKVRAESTRRIRWSKCATVCVFLSLICVTFVNYLNNREVELVPAVSVEAVDGRIVLPLADFDDRHLHRYVYVTPDNIKVRFIIIKKPRSGYGVGLDACDVCGPTGYYERKGEVVCMLCDVVMNVATIGFQGGCNPVPFPFELSDGKMVILADSLIAEQRRFR